LGREKRSAGRRRRIAEVAGFLTMKGETVKIEELHPLGNTVNPKEDLS